MASLLLIIEPRELRAERTAVEWRRAYADMQLFAEGLRTRGVLKVAESVRSDADGVRVGSARPCSGLCRLQQVVTQAPLAYASAIAMAMRPCGYPGKRGAAF